MAVTFLLAGVLGPVAFGTVAMATVYVLFVQTILQQGMVPAIIQRRNLRPEHLDSAFWMIMGTSAFLTILSVSMSAWWASVNQLPDLQPVIMALSILIPMKALVLVPEGILRREMNFRPLAMRTSLSVTVGGAVGLLLAFQGFGVWALVAQQLVTGAVELVVIWSVSRWRPGRVFSIASAKELLGFSATSSLASFGIFVHNRSDALLIGLFFGPAAVGLYRFAARLVDVLIDAAVRSLQAVSLPELSRLQDDRAGFSARLSALVRLSSILALPALGVLAAASDPLLAIVGSKWAAASGPLKLLCLVGAVRALTFFNGPMLQAIGRPQHLAGLAWGAALLSAGSFILTGLLLGEASTSMQIFGISLSRLVVYAGILFAINIGVLVRVTKLSLVALGRAVLPAAAGAAAAAAAGETFQRLPFTASWSPTPLLLGTVLSAALSASAILLLTDQELRKALRERLRPAVVATDKSQALTGAASG